MSFIYTNFSSLIGSAGVGLLLIAFFLNLFGWLPRENKVYMLLNICGAGLSCYASVLIHYLPFIVLEAVWCGLALAALVFGRSGRA